MSTVVSDVPIVERALEMTFVSDPTTATRLRALVEALDLPSDNIGARWAICKSMSLGPLEGHQLAHAASGGKELKGRTLFGGADAAALLLGQLLVVEGSQRLQDDVRGVVLGHWARGQQELERDMAALGGVAESLLVQELDRLALGRPPRQTLSAEIIGQPDVVERLETLWSDEATDHRPPVVVCGYPGSGRSHVARLFARGFGDAVVELDTATTSKLRDLETVLDRHPEATSLLVEGVDLGGARWARTLAAVRELRQVVVVATAGPRFAPEGWEVVSLAPYERDAVGRIVHRRYPWHLEVRRMIALAGRLRPRLVLDKAAQLTSSVGTTQITERHCTAAFREWGLDRLGLDQRDRAVVAVLASAGRAVSLSRLAKSTEADSGVLAVDVLPYLAELGLVNETRPGHWALTPAGAETYG